jgi:hypothetical protein
MEGYLLPQLQPRQAINDVLVQLQQQSLDGDGDDHWIEMGLSAY